MGRPGLDYLNSLEDWKGTGDFSPGPISQVLKALGNPQDRVNSVHIAGTNGKGSVAAAIAAILGGSGARVGLAVSPHLARCNERIVVDGKAVSDDLLNELGLEIKKASDNRAIRLTFFEGIVASAFLAFAHSHLDWIVVETGLGGRLDATNTIARPKSCVIVTIDWDHENILGNQLGLIAKEKAGIIKAGAQLILGALPPEASQIALDVAREARTAAEFVFGRDFYTEQIYSAESPSYGFHGHGGAFFEFKPSLRGSHQAHNMAIAIQTCLALGVSEKHCRQGVEKVFWPARLEEIEYKGKKWLLDCAHNMGGINCLANYLKQKRINDASLAFGVLGEKEWGEMAAILVPYVKRWSLLKPNSHRALDCAVLERHLSRNGIRTKSFGLDYENFISSELAEKTNEIRIITGSMYMVGGVRSILTQGEKAIWQPVAAAY